MSKNLRLTNSLGELASILASIEKNDIEIMIWQTIDEEKRILKGSLKSHTHKNEIFLIEFAMGKNVKVEENEKLYLFCQKKNILVKGKIKIAENNNVQIRVDKKFYLNEDRNLYRMDVTDKNIMMIVSRTLEQQNREKQETVILRDLCNDGCGFIITQSRATQFSINNQVQIEKFGTIQLKSSIKGKIAHISSVPIGNGINDNQYLVGMAFDETVPNIDHFLQMIEFGMTEF